MNDTERYKQGLTCADDSVKRERIPQYSWYILAITMGIQASIAFVQLGIGPLAPFFESALGLNRSQIGLFSGVFCIGSASSAIFVGRIIDLRGEKIVAVVCTVLTGIGTIIASRCNSYYLLLAAFFFTGLLATCATPAGSKAILQSFPKNRIGFALSVRQTSVPIGGLLAALIIPPVALIWGWHAAVLVMGIAPITMGIVFQLTYRVPNEKIISGKDVKPTTRSWAALKNRNIWLVSLTAMTYLAAQSTVLTYFALYLHDHAGISTGKAGVFLVVANLGGIIGRVFWGSISDTVFRGKMRPAFGSVGLSTIFMALVMLLLGPGLPVWVLILCSVLLGFSAIGWNGVYVAFIAKLAGKEQAGTALGLSLTIHYIGGLVFPFVFGLLADINTNYKLSWLSLAVLLGIGVSLVGIIKEAD